MIYRAAKVQKKRKSCKRLRKKNVKFIVLYVIQHKIGVYYCAREKKLYLCKLLLACYVMRLNVKIRKQHKF